MASKQINVTVMIGSETVDPDGTECDICGDACYLSQVAVVATVNGSKLHIADVCGSCRDAFKDQCQWL